MWLWPPRRPLEERCMGLHKIITGPGNPAWSHFKTSCYIWRPQSRGSGWGWECDGMEMGCGVMASWWQSLVWEAPRVPEMVPSKGRLPDQIHIKISRCPRQIWAQNIIFFSLSYQRKTALKHPWNPQVKFYFCCPNACLGILCASLIIPKNWGNTSPFSQVKIKEADRLHDSLAYLCLSHPGCPHAHRNALSEKQCLSILGQWMLDNGGNRVP